MTLAAAITLIAAALAPWIVALFKRTDMSDTKKRVIVGLVALLLGSMVAVATGQITGVPQTVIDWLAWFLISVGVVLSISQGFYLAWKDAVNNISKSLTLRKNNLQ